MRKNRRINLFSIFAALIILGAVSDHWKLFTRTEECLMAIVFLLLCVVDYLSLIHNDLG